jgi:hypothetical protein
MSKFQGTVAAVLAACVLSACSDSTEPSAERFNGCAVTPYTIGSSVSGSLGAGDCTFNHDGETKYLDQFGFSVTATRTITIDMVATGELDSYLVVWNRATGAIVAEDDDGGTGWNARLTRSFEPGNYVIGATSYDAYNDPDWPGVGNYTLSSQ